MSKKGKVNPNVHIRVRPNHLYADAHEYEGKIKNRVIQVNMRHKSIAFSAQYKAYKKSHRVSIKMEQLGQIEFCSDGKLILRLEPLQQPDNIVITLELQDPAEFQQRHFQALTSLVKGTNKNVSIRNQYEQSKASQMKMDEEEAELLEASNLIKEDLDKSEKDTNIIKKSPCNPMRRSLRLQQPSPQKKRGKSSRNKIGDDNQKQSSIDIFLRRKSEPQLQQESKEEVKVKVELKQQEDKRPALSEIQGALRQIVRRVNAKFEEKCAFFSIETMKFLIKGDNLEMLKVRNDLYKSLPEGVSLLKKHHWILPLHHQDQIFCVIVTHPYNIYNHAIADRTINYNKIAIKSVIKRDPLESELEIQGQTEKANLIMIGNVNAEVTQTIRLAIQRLLSFVFFKQYVLGPGKNQNTENQLKPILVGPFTHFEARTEETNPFPNLFKFFFLNSALWKPEHLLAFYNECSIYQTIPDEGSSSWTQIVGAVGLFAERFRLLPVYSKRKQEGDDFKLMMFGVKREANQLNQIPLGRIGQLLIEEGFKTSDDEGKKLRERIREVVQETMGAILEECTRSEARYDERGLHLVDDIKEEQKSLVGRG